MSEEKKKLSEEELKDVQGGRAISRAKMDTTDVEGLQADQAPGFGEDTDGPGTIDHVTDPPTAL